MEPPLRFPQLPHVMGWPPKHTLLTDFDCSRRQTVHIAFNSGKFRWCWAFGGNRYQGRSVVVVVTRKNYNNKICRIIWCCPQTTVFTYLSPPHSAYHKPPPHLSCSPNLTSDYTLSPLDASLTWTGKIDTLQDGQGIYRSTHWTVRKPHVHVVLWQVHKQ